MKGNCGDQSSDTTFGEASSLSASWTRSVVIGRFEYAVMDDCPIFPSAKSPCFSSTQRGNENAIEMPISRKNNIHPFLTWQVACPLDGLDDRWYNFIPGGWGADYLVALGPTCYSRRPRNTYEGWKGEIRVKPNDICDGTLIISPERGTVVPTSSVRIAQYTIPENKDNGTAAREWLHVEIGETFDDQQASFKILIRRNVAEGRVSGGHTF